MIIADDINNTALYGFHPDFVREENDTTPFHEENVKGEEAEYLFNSADAHFTGILLSLVIGLMATVFLLPLL